MSNTKTQLTQVTPVVEKTITDDVLNRINQMMNQGALKLPANYSPENALKFAYFKLLEVVNKDKQPIFVNGSLNEQICSKASVANTLYKMVVQGLDVAKTQCYFVMYGNQLTLTPSYFGSIAKAKRAGLEAISSQVIYEGDVFSYEINPETGRKKLLKHEQNFENIEVTKIKGAYAIYSVRKGDTVITDLEVMNIAQIKKSWDQGKSGQQVHGNFTDQMAMKTVIGRACKMVVNTSDDADLLEDEEASTTINALHEEINENANKTEIGIPEKTQTVSEIIQDQQPEKVPVSNDLFDNGKTDGAGF